MMQRSILAAPFLVFLASCTSETSKPVPVGGSPVDAAASKPSETSGAPAKAATDAAAKVNDPGFSLDSLKAALGSASKEQVTQMADKITAAITSQTGVVADLTNKLKNLGVADLAKSGEIKTQMDAATSTLKGLKDKLQVVVDKLKEFGVDVSKYTSLLGG